MKKTTNKFYQRALALVLALMLCVGMMPLTAFAEGKYPNCGKCGELVYGDQEYIYYDGRYYHRDCAPCNHTIGGTLMAGTHGDEGPGTIKCQVCNGSITCKWHKDDNTSTNGERVEHDHLCDYCHIGLESTAAWGKVEVNRTEPTCTEPGKIYYACSYSGGKPCTRFTEEVQSAPALGHKYPEAWTDSCPDHKSVGCETHHMLCERCGVELKTEAHDFGDWVTTLAAQAGIDGKKERTCKVCHHVQTEVIPALPVTVKWYNGYEADPKKTIEIAKGSEDYKNQYPENPTRPNYEFEKWGDPVTDTVGNITITAEWKKFTYTLRYDANGGSNAPGDQTAENVGTISYGFTVSADKPTRDGYTFKGWSDTSGANNTVQHQAGATITLQKDASTKTIYAVWEEEKVVLTYHKNDGTGTVKVEDAVTKGTDMGLKLLGEGNDQINWTVPAGYTFKGWSMDQKADPTDATKILGATLQIVENTNVYAIWEAINYTVTYTDGDKGGAAFEDQVFSTLVENGTTRNLHYGDPTPSYTPASYTDPNGVVWHFDGWNPVVSSTVTDNATYVAQWTRENSFILNYNGNGGTPVRLSDSAEPSTATSQNFNLIELGNRATRPGYTFIGWSETEGGTTAATSVTVNANVPKEVYAIWEPINYTVTYTDGVEGREVFEDQVTGGLHYGDDTPDSPSVDSYVDDNGNTWNFTGWSPAVAETVTGDAIYTAVWERVITPTPTPTSDPTPTPTPEPTDEPTDIPDPTPPLTESPDVTPTPSTPPVTPDPEPSEPPVEIPDEDPPLAEIPDEDPPLAEIPDDTTEIDDEEVPLADVPKTGDDAKIWLTLALLSAAGLGVIGLMQRRTRKSGKHS